MADEIKLEPVLRDALLHGTTPRDRDKALEDEARNAGQPIDRPLASRRLITIGGQSQQLFPARNRRRKFFIQNPAVSAASIFVRTDGVAATTQNGQSIEIPPGGFLSDDEPTSLSAFTITSPISALAFYAEELL